MSEDYTYDAPVDWRARAEAAERELADVLEVALIRGESLGYTTIDNDYRARLRELRPDSEMLVTDALDAPLTLAALDNEDGDL